MTVSDSLNKTTDKNYFLHYSPCMPRTILVGFYFTSFLGFGPHFAMSRKLV